MSLVLSTGYRCNFDTVLLGRRAMWLSYVQGAAGRPAAGQRLPAKAATGSRDRACKWQFCSNLTGLLVFLLTHINERNCGLHLPGVYLPSGSALPQLVMHQKYLSTGPDTRGPCRDCPNRELLGVADWLQHLAYFTADAFSAKDLDKASKALDAFSLCVQQ